MIVSVAIKFNNVILSLPRPARHCDIINTMADAGIKIGSSGQGFLTSDGKFVNRKEAVEVALAFGQMLREKMIMPHVGLDSGDVW